MLGASCSSPSAPNHEPLPQVAAHFTVRPLQLDLLVGDSAPVEVIAFLESGDTLNLTAPATGGSYFRWTARDTFADTTLPLSLRYVVDLAAVTTTSSTVRRYWVKARAVGTAQAIIEWGNEDCGHCPLFGPCDCTFTPLLPPSLPIAVTVQANPYHVVQRRGL